jgi:hypothetical protein
MTFRTVDQFPFEFYGHFFSVALANDRKLYVPLAALCQAMDLQIQGQTRRIRENEAMADALVMLHIEWGYGDDATQEREMLCLRLDRLPFWMGTLQPGHIKNEKKRQQIIRFQREFADVAWAAFRREILPDDWLAEMDGSLPRDEQEYLRLMDEAATLRQEIGHQSHKIHGQGQRLGSLEDRVAALEAQLKGTDFINPKQMRQYSDMVAIVAKLLKRKRQGHEATVHAEVKRVFEVPSYQLLPEADFDRVRKFLADWHRRLAGPDAAVPGIFEQPSQKRLL